MIKYNFQINKEACFVYWLQIVTKWIWYYSEKKVNYFNSITGEFNEEEKKAQERFKELLQRKDSGYVWLWDRYTQKPFESEEGRKEWEEIKKVFERKFEILWENEHPKLLKWQKTLQEHDVSELNKNLEKVKTFYGVEFDEEITIQLNVHFNKYVPGGQAKKEYKNFISLNLSNMIISEKQKDVAIDVAFHEIVHLIENIARTTKEKDLVYNSYLKIIKPTGIKQKSPAWRYLLNESIISSIAGYGFSYFWSKKHPPKKAEDKKEVQKKREDVHEQIKTVSQKLVNLTGEYLKNGREIDSAYTDQVAKLWVEEKQS